MTSAIIILFGVAFIFMFVTMMYVGFIAAGDEDDIYVEKLIFTARLLFAGFLASLVAAGFVSMVLAVAREFWP